MTTSHIIDTKGHEQPIEFEEPVNGPYSEGICPRCDRDVNGDDLWRHPPAPDEEGSGTFPYFCISPLQKAVFVPIKDRPCSPGKMAAQVAHAATALWENARGEPDVWHDWFDAGQMTLVLEPVPLEVAKWMQTQAKTIGLPNVLWWDRGLTEVEDGFTMLGIGPGPVERIDAITGDLQLFTPKPWWKRIFSRGPY